jgi:glycosyltransferase involved in cell wall biosynthesis
MTSLVLIVPGQLNTRTGGYIYDRHVVEGLRGRGWRVDVREIDDDFPRPSPGSLGRTAALLQSLPDRTLVLIDGLAFGAMPDIAISEASRLRLVALVHHPLALETGLDPASAAALETSEQRALTAARLVVVTSRATKDGLLRYAVPADRIEVAEPGTDRASLATGSGSDCVALLCVAAVVPRKRHECLVEALASIPERNWRLTCAGSLERDRQTAQRLRAMIDAHGLAEHIAFVGEQNEEGLARLYESSDAFVLPSDHEGYGMALAEALAHGLPAIATPTGAAADLVGRGDDAAGILVEVGDRSGLERALSRVVGDRAVRERLAAAARRRRDQLPTWDDTCARMEKALCRV